MKPVMLKVAEGKNLRDIAVLQVPGADCGISPGIMWLGGYRSDMLGTKADAVAEWALQENHDYCRFDYSGHGASGGESDAIFRQGTISRWLEESLAVFDAFTKGPQILVASSMGAWIALRMAAELLQRDDNNHLHGLILLAPAPDFTHELMLPDLSDEQKSQLEIQGYLEEASQYSDEPNIFTRALFEDGDKNRVMTGMINTNCPVHIIQGMKDEDVPYQHAMKLLSLLPAENVTMTLVKDGDHRLSREQDIKLMLRALKALADTK